MTNKFIDLKDAYENGQESKKKGFMRVTPYYENEQLDKYWFAGYDDIKIEDVK